MRYTARVDRNVFETSWMYEEEEEEEEERDKEVEKNEKEEEGVRRA